MRFDILTLFPAMFEGFLNESLLKKAQERGLIFIHIHDIRPFCTDKHNSADDAPFGGGPGMVMMADPILRLHRDIKTDSAKTILLTPAGQKLDQNKVKTLSTQKQIILICGHYEGIDERIMPIIDEEISVGDFVLTGGELPAASIIDAVSRYIQV